MERKAVITHQNTLMTQTTQIKTIGEEAAEKIDQFLQRKSPATVWIQNPIASIIDRIVEERGLGSASVGERWLNPDGSLLPSEPAGAPPAQGQPSTETGVRPNEVVVQDGRVMSIPPHIAVTMRTCVHHTDRERNEAFGFDNGKGCPVCAMRAASNLHAQQTPTDSVREPKSVLVEKTKEAIKRLKRWIAEGNPCTEVNDDILTVCNFAEEEKENE